MKHFFMRIFLLILPASSIFAHGNEGVEPFSVGPEKGVIHADEHDGFVLRPSAEQNFAIKKIPIKAGPNWTIPREALVYSGLKTQVFRQRQNHWRSVDVEISRKSSKNVEIRSKELQAGDQLAVDGIGFLKIIEQSVFGPVADGHGH